MSAMGRGNNSLYRPFDKEAVLRKRIAKRNKLFYIENIGCTEAKMESFKTKRQRNQERYIKKLDE